MKIQQDLEQDLKGRLDLDQRWGEKGTWAVGGSRIPGEMGRCRAGGRETGAGAGGGGDWSRGHRGSLGPGAAGKVGRGPAALTGLLASTSTCTHHGVKRDFSSKMLLQHKC